MSRRRGRCLCGLVRFEYEGRERWRAHCHGESCRRATASPFTTFPGFPDGRWRWTGAEPASFESSPGVRRRFCPRCGTPMAHHGPTRTHETGFCAATLADSRDFAPEAHVHWAEHLPWIRLADDLPRT